MGTLVLNGATSGATTLQPSDATTQTITLPTGNVTLASTTGAVSNLSGGAQGSVPYQSAANTTSLLAAGTAGQVLTTQGAGANPTWTTPSAGAMTLISTSTVSNAASVAFTGLTNAYSSYMIVLLNVYNTGTGGYPLYMQVSTDNSTYLSANYFWSYISTSARSGSSGSIGTYSTFNDVGGYGSKIVISNNGSGGSGSVVPVTGEIKIRNPGGGAQATVIQSSITACDSTPTFEQNIGYGANTTTSAIQAVKIYFSTGNIWGTFKLYGIT